MQWYESCPPLQLLMWSLGGQVFLVVVHDIILVSVGRVSDI